MDDFNAWMFHIRSTVVMDWQLFALLALFIYGFYQYLLDYSIETACSTYGRPMRSMATYLLLCGGSATIVLLSSLYLIIILLQGKEIWNVGFAALLGLLQGLLFLYGGIFRFEARKVFPNNLVLPITRTSILIVIVMSWVLFDEFDSLTGNRLVGFTLIGLAIYLFKEFETRGENKTKSAVKDKGDRTRTTALMFLILATLVSATISLLAKYAVGPSGLNIFLFVLMSNIAICFAAIFLLEKQRKNFKRQKTWVQENPSLLKEASAKIFRRGMVLGIFNFIAFASLLNALSLSDASVVIPIYSLYIVIPVLLTAIIQGEVLTPKTTVAVILSVAAVITLR